VRAADAPQASLGQGAGANPEIDDQPLVATKRAGGGIQHRFVPRDERADARVVVAQVDPEMAGDSPCGSGG